MSSNTYIKPAKRPDQMTLDELREKAESDGLAYY